MVNKKIEGNKILYKKRNIFINAFWAVLIGVFIEEFMPQGYGKTIFESIWPIFWLCLSAFFSQVYLFYYVVKLERKMALLYWKTVKVDIEQANPAITRTI